LYPKLKITKTTENQLLMKKTNEIQHQFTPEEEKLLQKMIADVKKMREDVKKLTERIDYIILLEQPVKT